MPSRISRFTDHLVTLAKRAVPGDPDTAVKKGDGGYADWVIAAIHGLREYLDLPYRGGYDDDTGLIQVFVDTDSPMAREWAERVYASAKADSTPFDSWMEQ